MMRIVFLVSAAALALVACNGSVEPTELPDEPAAFAGTEWDLLSLYGTQAIPGTSITLEFMEDRLVGFAGCNNYGAPYTATTLGAFEALEVERTEIGCLEPEGVLVQEGVFEQALLSAVRYEQTPATLTFFDENGHSVLQFVTHLAADPTEVPEAVASEFWVEAIDDRTGLRFAVPCFWEVNIPTGEQDPSGMGAVTVRNYDQAFVMAHPRGAIGEDEGTLKIGFTYIPPSDLDLPPGASLDEFVQNLVGSDNESGILSVEPIGVNGLDALFVTQQGTYGIGYFAVVPLQEDLYLLVSSGGENSDDFQGILHSIAYAPDASVVIPSFDPAAPPLGVDARCMGKAPAIGAADLTDVLQCDEVVQGSAESLACELQTALLARDMQNLPSFMTDPFTIGYWGSEGGWASPEDMVRELDNARLPQDTSGLTFTTDRALFPPLAGTPPELMFGPDLNPALLVYSEGWGPDGLGAGILYLIEDDSGAYYWSNLAYSHEHFDR